jgi:hypothetical protein
MSPRTPGGKGPPERENRPGQEAALENKVNTTDQYIAGVAKKQHPIRERGEPPAPSWKSMLFRVDFTDGTSGHRLGCAWGAWGIVYVLGRRYRVIHRPSGGRLTEFDRLAIARRFCEAIDPLTDWSVKDPPRDDKELVRAIHRAAMRLTGSKPELRAIAGGDR